MPQDTQLLSVLTPKPTLADVRYFLPCKRRLPWPEGIWGPRGIVPPPPGGADFGRKFSLAQTCLTSLISSLRPPPPPYRAAPFPGVHPRHPPLGGPGSLGPLGFSCDPLFTWSSLPTFTHHSCSSVRYSSCGTTSCKASLIAPAVTLGSTSSPFHTTLRKSLSHDFEAGASMALKTLLMKQHYI